MSSARFLLGPRWIVSHVLVVLLVVVMVNLGFWQLRRLDDRRAENALIEARQDEPAVPLDEVLAPDAEEDEVEALRARPVTLEGRYDDAATVVVRNRTLDGVAGAWIVTPLQLGGGQRVAVVRGFVALGPDGDPYAAPVPAGRVAVAGAVMVPRLQDRTVRKDLEDLLQAPSTLGVLVRAERSDPPEPTGPETADGAGADGGDDPRAVLQPLPEPELNERNHLSYAVQWFIFSTIAVVGYPLVLRRVVQRRGKEADGGDLSETRDAAA